MEKGIEFEYRDILKAPLSVDELRKLAKSGDITVKNLVNKGSKAFKNLKLDPANLTEEDSVQIILENPRTMVRPLFSDGSSLVAGFKEKEVENLVEGK